MAFLAEDTPVTIVPNFALPSSTGGVVSCVCGDLGPFSPAVPVDVPLWAALALHAMKRCRVVPPAWLTLENLAAVDEAERASAASFEPLPPAYLEVGRRLLTHCRSEFETREYDDVSESEREGGWGAGWGGGRPRARARGGQPPHRPLLLLLQIVNLLECVRSARFAKLRDGLEALRGAMAVKLAHVAPAEINCVRPFFAGALAAYASVDGGGGAEEAVAAEREPLGEADAQAPPRRLRRGAR